MFILLSSRRSLRRVGAFVPGLHHDVPKKCPYASAERCEIWVKKKDEREREEKKSEEEMRLRKDRVIADKLPIFWQEFLEYIDAQCLRLREEFPNNKDRHLSMIPSPGKPEEFTIVHGEMGLPLVTVILNSGGQFIYVVEGGSLETFGPYAWHGTKIEIPVDVENNNGLILRYKGVNWITPKQLADTLMPDWMSLAKQRKP